MIIPYGLCETNDFKLLLALFVILDVTEDIFQDTFIKVIKTLRKGSYSEEGKFLPWVMRIAHNLVIDHFRKNKRMPMFEGSDDFNIFSVIGDDQLNIEKQLIKDQIDNGMNEDEVYEFLTDKYGEWIVYKPKFNSENFMLWFLPYFVLAVGGVIFFVIFKKGKNTRVN